MGTDSIHAPRDRLSLMTLVQHQAVRSLIEELDAVDWYRQRADDCSDADLKEVLLHNMREEIEHACMILEWLRRHDGHWQEKLATYLNSAGPIVAVEVAEEGREASASVPPGVAMKTASDGTQAGEPVEADGPGDQRSGMCSTASPGASATPDWGWTVGRGNDGEGQEPWIR